MTQTLHIAAACLIDAHGRLLTVRKRGTTKFMLPGGKREPGEAPLDAVRREVFEELELHLEAVALQLLGKFQAVAANELDTRVQAHIYTARIDREVAPAAELEELSWLNPADELPANLAPLLRDEVIPALRQAGIF